MKKVLINTDFKDIYTGELHKAGEYATFTEERITEIKAVNPNFVTVVGNVETPAATTPVETSTENVEKKSTKGNKGNKGNKGKKVDAPVETSTENAETPAGDPKKPSVEDLIDDLEDDSETPEE